MLCSVSNHSMDYLHMFPAVASVCFHERDLCPLYSRLRLPPQMPLSISEKCIYSTTQVSRSHKAVFTHKDLHTLISLLNGIRVAQYIFAKVKVTSDVDTIMTDKWCVGVICKRKICNLRYELFDDTPSVNKCIQLALSVYNFYKKCNTVMLCCVEMQDSQMSMWYLCRVRKV